MANLASIDVYTRADVIASYKDGRLLEMANVLLQNNPFYERAVWLEANGDNDHTYRVVKTLPSGGYKVFNDGFPIEAVKGTSYREGVSMFGSWYEIDVELLNKQNNQVAYRARDEALHAQGLSNQMQSDVIYGSLGVDPASFNGLHVRTDDLSLPNVINGGASGSATTSIYLISWGPMRVYMIFPKNGTPGNIITAEDKGKQTVYGADASKLMEVYRTKFQVEQGMVIQDPRCLQAIKNIQLDDSQAAGYLSVAKMRQAIYKIPRYLRDRAAFYVTPRVMEILTGLADAKANVIYPPTNPFGTEVLQILGIPIYEQDSILETEQASV